MKPKKTRHSDSQFEVLYDHYKDSFGNIQKCVKFRDRLFLLILIVITLMLFQVFSPKDAGDLISQYIGKNLGLTGPINISFIGSVIWFSMLALAIRYFQTVVHIERQYSYVHQLEDDLNQIYGNKIFTREGKAYLENYPLFSSWAWLLYTIIFPLLLIFIAWVKINSEWQQQIANQGLAIIDTAIFGSIVISTGLYLLLVHFRK